MICLYRKLILAACTCLTVGLILAEGDARAAELTTADGTNGADATIFGRQGSTFLRDTNFGAEPTMEVRASFASSTRIRKPYMRFDLSALPASALNNITSVKFSGFAGETDDVAPITVQLWGINDAATGDDGADWTELGITYNNAPQLGDPDDGTTVGPDTTLLSTLTIVANPGGDPARFNFSAGHEFEFPSTPAFVNFLNSDTNGVVTLIANYDAESGSSLKFNSRDATGTAPTLTIIPEPSTLLLAVAGLVGYGFRRRGATS